MSLPSESVNEFPATKLQRLVMIEVCAGSARLSASFRDVGAVVFPFDNSRNRHVPCVTVFELDLTQLNAWQLLSDIIKTETVSYIHVAPPCGTASSARGRPIPEHLKVQGAPEPRALRSMEFPMGIPGLSPAEDARVQSANKIYNIVVKLIYLSVELQIAISIENPPTSLFWHFPGMQQASHDAQLIDYEFHGCMYGGERRRLCRWRATNGLLDGLDKLCDSSHSHKPWGVSNSALGWVFATAEEAAYPKVLTDFVARQVSLFLNFEAPPEHSKLQGTGHSQAAIQSGLQPRKAPQLVSEFACVESFGHGNLPKNSKVLREVQGGDEAREPVVVAGVYRTPEEYVSEALQISHPMDCTNAVPENLKRAAEFIVENSPVDVCRFRLHQLKIAADLAQEMSALEQRLHDEMEENVGRILKSKKVLLFEKLLKLTDYPDSDTLAGDIAKGFDIVGLSRNSTCLPKRLRPASISTEELQQSAVWNKRAVVSKCRKSESEEENSKLREETLQEVQKGWIRGPYTEAQVDKQMGTKSWLCVRRFALKQGNKTRIIDDCKEPRLNTALTTPEKLQLMGVDHFINLALYVAECSKSHQSFNQTFQGRTLDLTAAYKNLACSPSTRWASVLVIPDQLGTGHEFYISDALMFGSTAAVYAFNRCARGLWHLAVSWLKIPCTQFYDDFPCIETTASAKSSRLAFQAFLSLLGWATSDNPAKALDFSDVFKMLGVQVDLSSLHSGSLIVSNTEQRRTDILTAINEIMADGFVEKSNAASIFGKLNFALSAIFGRGAAPGLRILSQIASGSVPGKLDNFSRSALKSIVHFLIHAKPRTVSVQDDKKPLVLFTDAAYEQQRATYGLVLFADGNSYVSSSEIPESIVTEWRRTVGEQVISQAELYPIVIAKNHWKHLFMNRRVLIFVDNEAARHGLIKMSSPSDASHKLIQMYYSIEAEFPSYTWMARVPSTSNPADWPSRGLSQKLIESFGCQVVKIPEL